MYDELINNRNQLAEIRRYIDVYMKKIGTLQVRCPKCGTVQATTTPREKVCISCHKTFSIFPTRQSARIADTDAMKARRPLIINLAVWVRRERQKLIVKRKIENRIKFVQEKNKEYARKYGE
ncbi:MAG: hypothetical protein J7K29_02985 [Candidatus Cloacimonetes bacterium]|nr:hypothetical protein [Candidatus Cloacimonadota bacterium]